MNRFKRTFGGLSTGSIRQTDQDRRNQALARIRLMHPLWSNEDAEAELAAYPQYAESDTFTGPTKAVR
jgi:hypothetical protein